MHVTSAVAAGAGFLLAVLWFDLMFDVQVTGHRGGEVPEKALSSIAGYYRRATTEASPMNRLIAAAMLATLAGIVVQLLRHDAPRWVSGASLALAGLPIALAVSRSVPSAVRLGGRADSIEVQSRLATSVLYQHLFCITLITALLVIQLVWA